MRTYIEKLGKEYIEGRKESGKSPLRTGLYGERLRSMSWKRTRLFSYQTHVATIDRQGKVLYITTIHNPLPGKCGILNGSQDATAFISYLPNALKIMHISLKDSIIHIKVKT